MKIINRKFSREFEAIEKFEAGIVLSGPEVKAVRGGGLLLDNAFVKILESGPILMNAQIPAYKYAKQDGYDPKRSRKLLLSSKEILKIQTKIRGGGGLTVVPIACYNKGNILKLEIALVRGLNQAGKRKHEKLKKIKRDQMREAKNF